MEDALGTPDMWPCSTHSSLTLERQTAWKRLSKPLTVEEIYHVEDSTVELDTVYWHILDHARNNGTWTPPIKGL